jgi:branched-chain amino acid transport system permease protein
MVDLLQQILNGLVIGSVYALVALGLTLIYGILYIPNFAHGQAYMWAAYVTYVLITFLGLNYWLVIFAVTFLFILLGMGIEWAVFKPLLDKPHINGFIAAIGLVMLMESVVLIFFGAEYHKFPEGFSSIISVGDLVLTRQRMICILGSFVLIFLLYLFIHHTRLGESIQAVAQNETGAKLVGINVKYNSAIAFGLGTGLAATAAALIAPIFLVFPQMGGMVNLKAFVIIILGSMGSLLGAVIGGFMMGLIEALVSGYLSASYKDFIAFGVLVVVLIFKPTGLFGGKT